MDSATIPWADQRSSDRLDGNRGSRWQSRQPMATAKGVIPQRRNQVKAFVYKIFALLVFGSVANATEVCMVGAGIGHDSKTDTFVYIAEIGEDGDADERPITPLNESVAKVLATAAEEMKTDVRV